MRTLAYIYTVIYLVMSAWTIFEDVKEREPSWDIASDAIFLPLGGIGILFFLIGVSDPTVKSIWKVISIAVAVGQVLTVLISRHLIFAGKKPDLDPAEMSQWAILGADLVTILLLAPMFAQNFLFAFS